MTYGVKIEGSPLFLGGEALLVARKKINLLDALGIEPGHKGEAKATPLNGGVVRRARVYLGPPDKVFLAMADWKGHADAPVFTYTRLLPPSKAPESPRDPNKPPRDHRPPPKVPDMRPPTDNSRPPPPGGRR